MDGERVGRLPPDSIVGDYRVRALIGEGAMGEVYLAQDQTLGRRVALKVVRGDGLGPDAMARLLEEARATATFAHPHIVTLYAVGNHEGRPYLALEFLDGESLRARLGRGPMARPEALRVVRAIAEAVAEAHERGIVHSDLKPENVIVPRDGRLRVVDFGLARLLGAPGIAPSGTPSYMAPERWSSAAPSGAIDVWAIGVLLFELCTGTRPWSDAELARLAFSKDEPPLPPRHDEWLPLVRDCLRRSPAARPSAARVVQRLSELLEPNLPIDGETACPFPGLVAFARADSANFFGRSAEIDVVTEAVRRAPLVPVAGRSGVGKSSFVTAAVAPRLEESGDWITVVCRPGTAPFVALAGALGYDDVEALRAEPTRVALALAACAQRTNRRVLLVVDQCEECFTLAGDDGPALCSALAEAARADEPWRLILTVRDDFLARLAAVRAMRPHLGELVMLAPMSMDDLRAAVRGPLANVRYTTDTEALAARLAADVIDQPASLALLQFACRALWERRDVVTKRVTTPAYEQIGGASGALASHAESVLAALAAEKVRSVRSVFLELVAADGTRRPRPRDVLEDGHLGDIKPLVDVLIDHRLLVTSQQFDDAAPVVEIAHEALATAWPRLARWLDETHEERLLLSELEQAATLWSQRGRRDEETWTGPALAEALRKVTDWNVRLPSESRRFLDAGRQRTERRRRVRRWLFGGGTTVLVAATVIAVLIAVRIAHNERIAQTQKQQVLAQQAEIKLAAADMGRFELVLEPFDWDPATQTAGPPARHPSLSWKLRSPGADDPGEVGREYVDGDDVRRGVPQWRGDALTETVEARSGRAFLEIDRGADCAKSRITLQRLPGFRERAVATRLTIAVPTCAASAADMIAVEQGPFWRNVDHGADAANRDERVDDLPSFAIDAHEVTRAAFERYLSMAAVTGESVAPVAYLDQLVSPAPSLPAVGLTFATARNYCRYLGKDLPTQNEWQKAFRGPDNASNPDPKRATPWITATHEHPVNVSYPDHLAQLAPIGQFSDDRSSYGVSDLAGNVSEWSRSLPTDPRLAGLRVVLGASWSENLSDQHHRIQWQNARPDATADYSIGLRCVREAAR